MKTFSLAATTALLAMLGAAMAQPVANPTADLSVASSVTSRDVGHWLYDAQGNKVGSIRSLSADGRTASIMVGSYGQPGSHEARLLASTLSMVNGRPTLRAGTVEALNTAAQR
jgi:hypothetical protein